MSKEQEIIDILKKMSSNWLVMPRGWSDNRQLGSANIAYKTYSDGDEYLNLDITIENVYYSVKLRHGRIVLEAPLLNPLNANRLLEIMKTIYQEATSPESLIEGEAKLRTEIAETKREISQKKIKLKKLEEELNDK